MPAQSGPSPEPRPAPEPRPVAAPPSQVVDGVRLVPRRTFTLEVWGEGARIVATQVAHLETQDCRAWRGWRPARLLEFLESRIGAAGLAYAETCGSGAGVLEPVPAVLSVHRFGLVPARGLLVCGGRAAARLRFDPAGLDLPDAPTRLARLQLLAQPVGAGHAVVLDDRTVDLPPGRTVDTVLGGRLPDRGEPFAMFAAVRVLVDRPDGRPRSGLGDARLELLPDRAP